MKKIYNIIDSELIVRVNNIKFRQEYGEVGVDSNIFIEGSTTVFATKFGIKDIMFVTLNGLSLIEGKHYTKTGNNKISIGYGGAAIKNKPSSTILVGYHHDNINYTTVAGLPPLVSLFTVTPENGKSGVVTLNYKIEPQEATNIYWSILAEGEANPIFSGSSLESSNGIYENDAGVSVPLDYDVTGEYYVAHKGTNLPFTLIVTYDMASGINKDEKVLATANYFMGGDSLLGYVNAQPPTVSSEGLKNISVTYGVEVNNFTPPVFTWELTKELRGGTPIVIASGNQDLVTGVYEEDLTILNGDNYSLLFRLTMTLPGGACCTQLSSDDIIVYVPADLGVGRAGYVDASIMSYVDGHGVRRKIGSLGTSLDATEYQNRVPRDIFTKDVSSTIINEEEYIKAPVNTFGGIVDYVYFVMEVPDAWGPVTFNQMLGAMNPDAFNIIPLGNGVTAYLYADAPSEVGHPSDYHIKN